MYNLTDINTASTSGSRSLPSSTVANPKGELKAITTQSGIFLDGPSVPTPPPFINSELHINITLADALILMPNYQKMLKALISNKKKLQELANTPLNENCSAVILKKLPEKLGDPGKFLISCGFSELKCKALADLGASINLMPLSVWKKLGLPELISTRMTLELANRAICTPARIARDVFVLVGKFTFIADFVIVDYESDPRVPLILGRPFLRTARALIDVHEGGNVLPEKLLDLDFTKDLHPPLRVNSLSGSTTYSPSSNQLLEEFADELAFIAFPLEYDDDLQFDIEIRLIKIILLILTTILLIPMPEMFTDEHALDYSSPPLFDEYDDDLFEVESNTENVYNDPFDSKGEKIKESKLLIDELDLPCNFLLPSEYDSLIYKDFSRVDALPSTNNEDKVFNPGILIQENLFEIITRIVQDKKLAVSHASLVIEDFDPPLYKLPFFKEVPRGESRRINSLTHTKGREAASGSTVALGLRINIAKSHVLGVGVPMEIVYQGASRIGCEVMKTPFKYLGIMVGDHMSRCSAWSNFIQKVYTRLSKWKVKTLCIGGRLTLLKSVLGAVPIYNLSIYKALKRVLHDMEMLHNNSLWSYVIRAIHGPRLELHSYSTQSVWGVILREVQLLASKGFDFLSRCKIRVGDGVNTKFWLDTWILDVPLSIRFPRLYALESDKQIKVAAKFGDSSLADSFRRQVRDGVEASQWVELLSLTGSVSLSSSSDRWICDCNEVSAFVDWYSWFSSIMLPIKLKTILEGVFYTSWWHIWLFQNRLIFYSSPPRRFVLFDDIVSSSFTWCVNRISSSFTWEYWLKNPYLISL
uniref:Reverse transcriptase domain-containing protein n=1 Tax=Tanacetum cinerariifolium TaxID=118510 RepID=A0A699GH29_TANCI|nr:reverse transcriptase domain-containing protein [Tanacetum cinerariifolium]